MPAELSDDLLTAQCFVFFLAGFETSSGTLTFALYELAKNEHVQEKLYEEIIRVCGDEFQNELTYECVQSMSYLDQIISGKLSIIRDSNFFIPSQDITATAAATADIFRNPANVSHFTVANSRVRRKLPDTRYGCSYREGDSSHNSGNGASLRSAIL